MKHVIDEYGTTITAAIVCLFLIALVFQAKYGNSTGILNYTGELTETKAENFGNYNDSTEFTTYTERIKPVFSYIDRNNTNGIHVKSKTTVKLKKYIKVTDNDGVILDYKITAATDDKDNPISFNASDLSINFTQYGAYYITLVSDFDSYGLFSEKTIIIYVDRATGI